MNTLQRSTVRSATRAQTGAVRRSLGRRFAHDEHAHGHSEPQAEPLGASFWTVLALIPSCYLLFQVSTPGKDGEPSSLTNLMDKWGDYREQNAIRNALHTRVVEQAGHDKNLFFNTSSKGHHDMRFPEVFGVGSPRAITAGSQVDLSKVMNHYKEINDKEEAEKMQRLTEGKIPGQEPYRPL